MKRLIYSILACLLSIQMGYAQGKSVASYQYWIDPTGNANAVTGTVNGAEVSFSFDTKNLTTGIHNLYYRFQDSDGMWSGLQSWLFYVNETKKNKEVKIVQGEYWIDSGEKQEIAINGEQVAFVLDVNKASEGMHTLNYQVKDNEGMNSPLQTWIFMKNALRDTTIVNKTASMEYWFDDKANVLQTYMSFNDTINFSSVDATPLKPGLHTLNYRVKDILGNYSCTHTWAFFKAEPKASRICWYKYWWNNNEDKAVKEEIESDGAVFVFNKELAIPTYAMTDGFSNSSVARFQIIFGDDLGNVSNIEWIDVSYPDVLPPVSVIEVDKEQANESVTLKWYVTNDQVEDYNIYYSENDQPFVLWMPNTTKESATFKGQTGSSYRFTVTARDKSDNRERLDESKFVKVVFKSN